MYVFVLQQVINRILEYWNSSTLVFQDTVLTENLHSFQTLLNNLNSPIYKAYFQFLSYILDIVNKLNLEFQFEKCKIYALKDRISALYKTILRNFLKKDYIDELDIDKVDVFNCDNFFPKENVYFGAKV